MNKFLKISAVVTVFVVMVGFAMVTAAFAQGPNQPEDPTPPGLNQAQNEFGTVMGLRAVEEAAMHEAIAGALGMSIETFEAAVAEGKTLLILAQEQGVDFSEVQFAMDAVHAEALQQAVEDGLVSQEQADWMLSRRGAGQNSQGAGMNRGQNNSPMGRMGRGAGSNGNQTGACLYQAS